VIKKSVIFSFLVLFSAIGYCQINSLKFDSSNKGRLYLYWGWNRGWFTNSDIHFSGDNYDFTLNDVRASDRQSVYSTKFYFGLKTLSIPQYNARIGYFFKNNWDISLGTDHMKYVVNQNQKVQISGFIEGSDSDYDAVYSNDKIEIKEGFLQFEHTDGLNYINADLRHSLGLIKRDRVELRMVEGIGLGLLVPRTNATLLDKERYDEFHLSGYGLSGVLGLNLKFLKNFFIQSELKGGFINMPDVRTSMSAADQASQSFWFSQFNVVFGGSFRLSNQQ